MNSYKSQNVLLPLIITLLLWFVLYFETMASMAKTWWTSDTFAHGLLIFPISFYLIWKKRHLLSDSISKPNYLFIVGLLAIVFLWILAATVDVQVIKQLAMILMLPAILASLYGYKILKVYAFPLFYLIFAVPFGEFLIPQLQEVTAIFTVMGLKLSGIPVFVEGMYISIPAGDFEVAVACSGIRYLIASLALGVLYAYLTYQKLSKRIIFIVLSLLIPIIANGIRAYGIVMIAHLSDMKYATGVDHLIYGWLFFGLVIFVLFYLGSFWRDAEPNTIPEINTTVSNKDFPKLIAIVSVISVLSLGPISHYYINSVSNEKIKPINLVNASIENWQVSLNNHSNWKPTFIGNDLELRQSYKKAKIKDLNSEELISVYIAYYQNQTQQKELINHGNSAFDLDKNKLLMNTTLPITIDSKTIHAKYYQLLHNYKKQRLVIGWYYVFGYSLNNPIAIKIIQAIGKITGLAREGYYIAYAIDYDGEESLAKKELIDFISKHWPQIKNDLP
ncbi:MAG: exosortase A [Gammaproteobacteria bacterium]|nr:exosortase A [Gammaproteobacteria bacterium]